MYLLKMDKNAIHLIDGYYIMSTTLTEAVATITAVYSTDEFKAAHTYLWATTGFCGTFDGNGYGWNVEKMPSGSIFPVIHSGGVIKNFSVVGKWGSGYDEVNPKV